MFQRQQDMKGKEKKFLKVEVKRSIKQSWLLYKNPKIPEKNIWSLLINTKH